MTTLLAILALVVGFSLLGLLGFALMLLWLFFGWLCQRTAHWWTGDVSVKNW